MRKVYLTVLIIGVCHKTHMIRHTAAQPSCCKWSVLLRPRRPGSRGGDGNNHSGARWGRLKAQVEEPRDLATHFDRNVQRLSAHYGTAGLPCKGHDSYRSLPSTSLLRSLQTPSG